MIIKNNCEDYVSITSNGNSLNLTRKLSRIVRITVQYKAYKDTKEVSLTKLKPVE